MPPLLDVRVQREDFDLTREAAKLDHIAGTGAVVTFTGLCRDEDGELSSLELEHYPGMAEAEMNRMAVSAIDRFGLKALIAIHRFGTVRPGENIVLVISAASHRQAAFNGASFMMDYLKTDAPFWKKEHFVGGKTGGWISAKAADHTARDSWTSPK